MKKTYMKPSMEVHGIMTSLPIANSRRLQMMSADDATAETGDVVLSNERGGNIINVGEGYNRSLW